MFLKTSNSSSVGQKNIFEKGEKADTTVFSFVQNVFKRLLPYGP